MRKFLELVERSVVVQGLITLMAFGTICALYLMGREVPELLAYACTSILGFYFGQKTLKGGN